MVLCSEGENGCGSCVFKGKGVTGFAPRSSGGEVPKMVVNVSAYIFTHSSSYIYILYILCEHKLKFVVVNRQAAFADS